MDGLIVFVYSLPRESHLTVNHDDMRAAKDGLGLIDEMNGIATER